MPLHRHAQGPADSSPASAAAPILTYAPAPVPVKGLESGRPASIGRYLVLNLVGKGAMGEVYAAYDPELERKIAIKLLRGKPGDGAEAAEGRLRMMREAQAIAKLSHPNVVVVYDVGAFQEQVFVAMEFIDGHTLWYWMHAQPRGWTDVLKIFAEAGRGLAAAHEKNLVHRDFKPENVMIGNDGQVRVMDFGLARTVGAAIPGVAPAAQPSPHSPDTSAQPAPRSSPEGSAFDSADLESTQQISSNPRSHEVNHHHTSDSSSVHLTRTGTILGTPAYMSPEQFLGRDTDPRTDQFSFCVALYEALYGQRPFAGNTHQALEANVVAGSVRELPPNSDVPSWLRTVVLRGLRPDADDRWPSMKALLAELEKNRLFAGRRRFADGAAAKLSDIWQAPVRGRPVATPARRQIREAFLATGKVYAAATFEHVSQILDRYAKSWSDMYIEICQATHVRGEQSTEVLDLRMACLMDLRERLYALCQIFRQANGDVVENALGAANALVAVERCANLDFLRSAVRPPEDPITRERVDRLRARLAEVRVLCQVGRLADGLKAVATLEPEVRGLNYVPLLAELLLESGKLHNERREAQAASQALEEAVWAAELSRHEEVAAEATTILVFATGETQERFDAADIWARHAETILRRIGGHETLWGWLFNNRGAVRRKQGRLAEALADMRLAVEAKEKAWGADSPDAAQSLSNIALYLSENAQPEEALPIIERSIGILNATFGVDHPRSAVVQYNYAEVLNAVGRFGDARQMAARALATFEREIGPGDITLSYPLTALGIAFLGARKPELALPQLERAANLCAGKGEDPAHLAEIDFALARTLSDLGEDLPRAHTLAQRARAEYAQARRGPVVERALGEVDRFLAAAVGW